MRAHIRKYAFLYVLLIIVSGSCLRTIFSKTKVSSLIVNYNEPHSGKHPPANTGKDTSGGSQEEKPTSALTFEEKEAQYIARLNADDLARYKARSEKDRKELVEMLWNFPIPQTYDDITTNERFLRNRPKFPADISDSLVRKMSRLKLFDESDEAIAEIINHERNKKPDHDVKSAKDLAKFLGAEATAAEKAFGLIATESNPAELLRASQLASSNPLLAYAAWVSSFDTAISKDAVERFIKATGESTLASLAAARQAILTGDFAQGAKTVQEAAVKNAVLEDYTWKFRIAELSYYTETLGWTLQKAVNTLYNTDPSVAEARSDLEILGTSAEVTNSALRFWDKSSLQETTAGVDDMRLAAIQTLFIGGESQQITTAWNSLIAVEQYMRTAGESALEGKLTSSFDEVLHSVQQEQKELKNLNAFKKSYLESASETDLQGFIADAQSIGERAAVSKRMIGQN